MNVFQCVCGARYKVPPGSEGRKARCKQCGRTSQLPRAPEGPIPLAEDPHAGFEPAATASGSMFAAAEAGTGLEDIGLPAAPRVDFRPPAGFWEDVGWTFLFFTSPHSLIMFCLVWFLTTFVQLIQWVPFGGWAAAGLAGLFVTAWYMSIIGETASGEDDLPKFGLTQGWWDDVVVPALQYTGTWVLLLLPAFIYAMFISGTLTNLPVTAAGADPVTVLLSGGGVVAPLVALVLAGIFLWPAALMCVSLGGLGSLLRIDLIITSVVNTFLPYTAIVILVALATFLPALITGLAVGTAAGAPAGTGTTVWLAIVACGLKVYFSIVVMRLIGLYYRHYKHELAWDWE